VRACVRACVCVYVCLCVWKKEQTKVKHTNIPETQSKLTEALTEMKQSQVQEGQANSLMHNQAGGNQNTEPS